MSYKRRVGYDSMTIMGCGWCDLGLCWAPEVTGFVVTSRKSDLWPSQSIAQCGLRCAT